MIVSTAVITVTSRYGCPPVTACMLSVAEQPFWCQKLVLSESIEVCKIDLKETGKNLSCWRSFCLSREVCSKREVFFRENPSRRTTLRIGSLTRHRVTFLRTSPCLCVSLWKTEARFERDDRPESILSLKTPAFPLRWRYGGLIRKTR